jgi:hypothetical protein
MAATIFFMVSSLFRVGQATPSKNGFAATQKSFPLRRRPVVIMIHDKPLTSSLERRKTFDSPLANHFSAVTYGFLIMIRDGIFNTVSGNLQRGKIPIIFPGKVHFCIDRRILCV